MTAVAKFKNTHRKILLGGRARSRWGILTPLHRSIISECTPVTTRILWLLLVGEEQALRSLYRNAHLLYTRKCVLLLLVGKLLNSVTAMSRFEKVWLWIVHDIKLCWYQCSVCNCVISSFVVTYGDVCLLKTQYNNLNCNVLSLFDIYQCAYV